MLILAIDTATKIGSVSLFHDKIGVIGELNLYVKTNHSSIIMELIDKLLKMTNYTFEEIDKIVVTTGPGSFTGLRIGISLVKGLCFDGKKQVIGINELDILAYNVDIRNELIVPLIDARKERVYYSIYKYNDTVLERIENYKDIELRELLANLKEQKVYFTGDGAIEYADIIKKELGEKAIISLRANSIPRSIIAAELSLNKQGDIYSLEPFYISKSQAEREKENKKI